MATPKQAVLQLGPNWRYDPRTRGARNIKSGATVSRRQLEKRYGRLQEEGYTSFEAKAKARAAQRLTGFREEKTGKFGRTFNTLAEAQRAIEGAPKGSAAVVLAYGNNPVRAYGRRQQRNVWRQLNFRADARATRRGVVPKSEPMDAQDMARAWDRRAARAVGRVMNAPRRFKVIITK